MHCWSLSLWFLLLLQFINNFKCFFHRLYATTGQQMYIYLHSTNIMRVFFNVYFEFWFKIRLTNSYSVTRIKKRCPEWYQRFDQSNLWTGKKWQMSDLWCQKICGGRERLSPHVKLSCLKNQTVLIYVILRQSLTWLTKLACFQTARVRLQASRVSSHSGKTWTQRWRISAPLCSSLAQPLKV